MSLLPKKVRLLLIRWAMKPKPFVPARVGPTHRCAFSNVPVLIAPRAGRRPPRDQSHAAQRRLGFVDSARAAAATGTAPKPAAVAAPALVPGQRCRCERLRGETAGGSRVRPAAANGFARAQSQSHLDEWARWAKRFPFPKQQSQLDDGYRTAQGRLTRARGRDPVLGRNRRPVEASA